VFAYANTANYSYATWAPADDTEATTNTGAQADVVISGRQRSEIRSRQRLSKSGEHTRLACWFRRPRRNNLSWQFTTDSELSKREKVRDDEDAIASTRDARATQEPVQSQTETASLD
jgi:hypothetical protein